MKLINYPLAIMACAGLIFTMPGCSGPVPSDPVTVKQVTLSKFEPFKNYPAAAENKLRIVHW